MATSIESNMDVVHTDETAAGASAQTQSLSKPTCVIVLGMAGSGKTTFVQVQLLSTCEKQWHCEYDSQDYKYWSSE